MPLPLGSRYLIEQFDETSKAQTGLVIPDEAKDALKVAKGKVVGTPKHDPIVNIGDVVYFNRFSGERIKDPAGAELLVLKDTELLAVD